MAISQLAVLPLIISCCSAPTRCSARIVAGVPVIQNRISFSGERGYRWYGALALMSIRLEKGWGAWGLEFRLDFKAIESGLCSFIDGGRDFVEGILALLRAPLVLHAVVL